jgi:hypothetical protein
MKKSEFYALHTKCMKENSSTTVTEKSDVLACKKFQGQCGLIKCLNHHNGTEIGKVL